MFQAPHPSDRNRTAAFTVLEVAGTEVRCTANHPLAGVTLHFNLEVVEIRDGTQEEVLQGRVMAPGEGASSGCCSDPNCDN